MKIPRNIQLKPWLTSATFDGINKTCVSDQNLGVTPMTKGVYINKRTDKHDHGGR